jgi:PAS domain S-box-containing protein
VNIVTDAQLMIAAAAFTLAAIHLRVSFGRRDRSIHLLFAIGAAGLGVFALFERSLMLAETPAEYGELLRYAHVAICFTLIAFAFFVREYLHATRDWLLWAFVSTRLLALVLNFTTGVNLNYLEITAIKKISFLGEIVSIPVGVPNRAMIVGQIGLLLSVSYFIDAAVSIWKKGDRWRGGVVGASVALLSVANIVTSISVFWGLFQMPIFSSPYFLIVLGTMGFELSYDLKRAAETTEELAKARNENAQMNEELALSASAGSVGVWTRDLEGGPIIASEKWREIFGFDPGQTILFADYLARIHDDDREEVIRARTRAERDLEDYHTEYRVVLPDGEIRWVGSAGRVERSNGSVKRFRGTSVDITKRKLAEETAHDLAKKLMDAQEKERARIARDLHDGLSQSMALLSINLQALDVEGSNVLAAKDEVRRLGTQINEMSAELHRISHELHPAKLGQLGLEAALKGFCRESGSSYGLKIHFDATTIPRTLPDDVSLCLFRIAQESLRNIAKHSGGENVHVQLVLDGQAISLTVTDDGCGFDPHLRPSSGSLGLISMSERIRAVHGTVTVDSSLGSGTTITARVPNVL